MVPTAEYSHFVAPSCKLELARFSEDLRIQDGARVWQHLEAIFLEKINSLIGWWKNVCWNVFQAPNATVHEMICQVSVAASCEETSCEVFFNDCTQVLYDTDNIFFQVLLFCKTNTFPIINQLDEEKANLD